MQNRPDEWTENEKLSDGPRNTVGDKDCKYLCIHEFLRQAAQGQSQALELLYIPSEHVIIKTEEWDTILANKQYICSQQGIVPIIGFARAQAHKAVLKGNNLKTVEKLIELTEGLDGVATTSILENITWAEQREENGDCFLLGVPVKLVTNDHGYKVVKIASRDYDVGLSLKRLNKSLKVLEEKYGTRTRAAAEGTFDYKSVTHAFRLVYEAKEFMATGYITFPRPEAKELLEIKLGNYSGDLDKDIDAQLDIIRQEIQPKSTLPLKPDYSKLNQLCARLVKEHVLK